MLIAALFFISLLLLLQSHERVELFGLLNVKRLVDIGVTHLVELLVKFILKAHRVSNFRHFCLDGCVRVFIILFNGAALPDSSLVTLMRGVRLCFQLSKRL